ncbi:MAG TPA: hypothetical protein VLL27_08705 [Solirubrobacterales bacterium]|nr:hypothetical protein [Solirubrobacterales bacterium]
MIPLGHVAGMPVEEFIPAVASTGVSLLAARVWLSLHLRRHERREHKR